MEKILEAIQAGASGAELSSIPLPDSYRAAYVRREDANMFEGVASADKDPRKSLHIGNVARPEIGPDEAADYRRTNGGIRRNDRCDRRVHHLRPRP